jgi:RNA polymerase sigma-70 factor (ECF subfamily)
LGAKPTEAARRARDARDGQPPFELSGVAFYERVVAGQEDVEDLDTARLVIRFQAGDEDAFAQLYTRYFDRIYGYLRVVLRDGHEAEDATQNVFIKLFDALPAYERRRPFGAWLFTIARNLGRDYVRRGGRQVVAEAAEIDRHLDRNAANEGDDEGGRRALSWVSDTDLLLFIERLPLPQRQVLVMRFMLGMPNSEICQVLDRKPADIRTLQHRGLRYLEDRMRSIGRTPTSGERSRMLRRPKQAQILRRRRCALIG